MKSDEAGNAPVDLDDIEQVEPVPDEVLLAIREHWRERWLPEKGAEFDIQYYAGEVPVIYGKEPHTWANAVSEGLSVTAWGEEVRISHRRQVKPLLPFFMMGEDGNYRRMLMIALNGDEVGNNADWYIHILGGQIVIAKERLNVGQIAPGITQKDQLWLDKARKM